MNEHLRKEYKTAKARAKEGSSQDQYNLGVLYEHGKGVDKDFFKAAKWYKRASKQGHPIAQLNLGTLHLKGKGVKKDNHRAANLFKKSALQGNPSAQFNLGACYLEGRGTELNYKQAFYWTKKAALQGNSLAQHNLSLCYTSGYGIKANQAEAHFWLTKSTNEGTSIPQRNLTATKKSGCMVPPFPIRAILYIVSVFFSAIVNASGILFLAALIWVAIGETIVFFIRKQQKANNRLAISIATFQTKAQKPRPAQANTTNLLARRTIRNSKVAPMKLKAASPHIKPSDD